MPDHDNKKSKPVVLQHLLTLKWPMVSWLIFVLIAIAVLVLAVAGNARVSPGISAIALGFVAVLLIIGTSLSRTHDDHDDILMPSWLMRLVFSFSFLGVLVLATIYMTTWQTKSLAAALAGAAAAFTVGALIGFIFGIPRALTSISGSASSSERMYAPNTNLERVSEWLTGIIVGLTLVQFDEIEERFVSAAQAFAVALGQQSEFFASAALILFGAAGFLLSYLWTRLRLLSDLTRADDTVRREPEYLEGLMHAHLFTAAPNGFLRAIEKGVEYRKRFRILNSRVLVFTACAYGQQHCYLKKNVSRGAESTLGVRIDEARELALHAISECLDHDISQLKLLYSLWSPDDDQLADDDLESLWREPAADELFDQYIEIARKQNVSFALSLKKKSERDADAARQS